MNNYFSLFSPNDNQSQKRNGVAIGIVTNIEDPEDLGRVKVKFPLRNWSGNTEYESFWAPIASWLAGSTRGAFFLPNVNDEVLVAFNDGNVDEPFVIGMLWNGKDKPPVTGADRIASGKPKISKLKSHGGHELVFNDEQGKETLEIHTPKGQKILLDDQNKKIEISDSQGKNKVTINGQSNEISCQSDKVINLKAQGCSVKIDASGGITIESGTTLKIKAQQVTIEAGASMDIKSTGMLNIKGSMVKIN